MGEPPPFPPPAGDLAARCGRIELIVTDVDGVLTDGSINLDEQGVETKRFHVRDGMGLALWHRAGKRSAILSGRQSAAVDRRAGELGIARAVQGAGDKVAPFRALLAELGVAPERACFIGDDLADLGPLRRAGLAACPADAVAEVRAASQLVAAAGGGQGCVREVIEVILKAQGRWDGLVATLDPPS